MLSPFQQFLVYLKNFLTFISTKCYQKRFLSSTKAALNLREEYKPLVLTLNIEAKGRGGKRCWTGKWQHNKSPGFWIPVSRRFQKPPLLLPIDAPFLDVLYISQAVSKGFINQHSQFCAKPLSHSPLPSLFHITGSFVIVGTQTSYLVSQLCILYM